MPIRKLGSAQTKPGLAAKESRNYADKTKFVVHGVEAGRRIILQMPLIEGREDEAGKSVMIEGVVTAKELKDVGVSIDNWIDRKLIAIHNKNEPWNPIESDEMETPKSNVKIPNSE